MRLGALNTVLNLRLVATKLHAKIPMWMEILLRLSLVKSGYVATLIIQP